MADGSALQSGFIAFYGLYWRKDLVEWPTQKLLGCPQGWVGKGKISSADDRSSHQMNFWEQKGVYVLYDSGLTPVYAGQAGLQRTGQGRSLGLRLQDHASGHYRNGWDLFSWFGLLATTPMNLREAGEAQRLRPKWELKSKKNTDLNELLASFEAVLIEGFKPRFNNRGGDLLGATYVNQWEGIARQKET